MRLLYGTGRVIYGAFFIYNGINHLQNTEALAGYAAAKRVRSPQASVQNTGVLLTLAGASIALGIKPKVGALTAAAFLAVASGIFHDFWNQEDAGAKQMEMIQFSKNMALLGGALAIAGSEEGGKPPEQQSAASAG